MNLGSDAVLIQRQQLPHAVRVDVTQQYAQGGTVARERLVGDEVLWDLLCPELLSALAHGEGVGLGEEVAHELVVVAHLHVRVWRIQGW